MREVLTNDFLPHEATFDSTLTDDLMITAWELDSHPPCFFTKSQTVTYNQPKFRNSLTNMTFVSANNPLYFKPAQINETYYMSGDFVAVSPAMFAYEYVSNHKNISLDQIRIVSIGSVKDTPISVNGDLTWE